MLTAANEERKRTHDISEGSMLEDDERDSYVEEDGYKFCDCVSISLNLLVQYTQSSGDRRRSSVREQVFRGVMRVPRTEASHQIRVSSPDDWASRKVRQDDSRALTALR